MKQTLQFDWTRKAKNKIVSKSRSGIVSFHFVSFRFVSLIEERKKERKKENPSKNQKFHFANSCNAVFLLIVLYPCYDYAKNIKWML